MKGMKHTVLLICLLALPYFSASQDIHFMHDVRWARDHYASQTPVTVGYCTDSLRIDTIYAENISTGELDMIVQTYPLARYEYYIDGALFRRIDIERQYSRRDTTWTEHRDTGELIAIVQAVAEDIPNGAYHEFFPNGNIRIKGTLDGYNPDGSLKKTGEWLEWDADGNIIREERYP